MWDEKCNCGKPARYLLVDGQSSCGKCPVCPPYEDVEAELKKVKQDFAELLEAANDVVSFREGTDMYKSAENIIRDYVKEYGKHL